MSIILKSKWFYFALPGVIGLLNVFGVLNVIAEWIAKELLHDPPYSNAAVSFISKIPISLDYYLIGLSTGLLLLQAYFHFFVNTKKSILEASKPYSEQWSHLETFYTWHAACLFVGFEPYKPILPESKPYPILKLINNAVETHVLSGLNGMDPHIVTDTTKIHRSALANYFKQKNMQSKFPF